MRLATTSPSNIYAEIRTSPNGNVLGTSVIINSLTIASATPTWVQFRFPDLISLKANTKYFLRLRSLPDSTMPGSGSAGPVIWDYLQTPTSSYAGGDAILYIGSLNNSADDGQTLPEYDFGFKIYTLQ